MGIDGKTLKAFGFLEEGEELQKKRWVTETKYISPHVGLRRVLEEDGHWSINLVIDEHTGKEEIKSVWQKIRHERDKLAQIQGHDLSDYFRVVINDLSFKQYVVSYQVIVQDDRIENRPIYKAPEPQDLAMDVNFDLLVYIIRASKSDQGNDRSKLAEHYFYDLLQSFAFSLEDIDYLKKNAEIELAEGECPFDIQSQPISESKMREKIRYIQKKEVSTFGNQSSPEAKLNLLSIHRFFLMWGDWNHGAELLKKNCP